LRERRSLRKSPKGSYDEEVNPRGQVPLVSIQPSLLSRARNTAKVFFKRHLKSSVNDLFLT
jgi:hypothetical protein